MLQKWSSGSSSCGGSWSLRSYQFSQAVCGETWCSCEQLLPQQLERWLMGRRGGWQYLLSCRPSSCLFRIILLTLGVFGLQTFLFMVFIRYQWQQRLKLSTLQTLWLMWARCSEVFWHLRDSTPPWTQTPTETGAAGGQISDQVTVFPQTPLSSVLTGGWWETETSTLCTKLHCWVY